VLLVECVNLERELRTQVKSLVKSTQKQANNQGRQTRKQQTINIHVRMSM
jgi:hypothetical protein